MLTAQEAICVTSQRAERGVDYRRVMISRLLCGLLTLVVYGSAAHASCSGPAQFRRLVGQPPDLFFTAGVPETKFIPQVWVNFESADGGEDCGASVRSNVPGVGVRETYCDWTVQPDSGNNSCLTYPAGQPAQADDASGPLGQYVHHEFYGAESTGHMRAIAVVYDGSTPAGTMGTIDLGIASAGEIAAFQALAQVNVYVTEDPAPATWFTATVTVANARGDSLELDHPLLNGRPKVRVLAMHYHQGRGWNHPVATHYDVSARRWRIRNEDGATMPPGEAFVVRIDPSVLKVRTADTSQRFIRIEHPSSDHNPYAVIVATPWSSGSRRMIQPYSVAYVEPHWLIIASDGGDFPASSRWRRTQASGFFVKVMGAGQYVDATLPTDPSGFQDTYLSNGAGIDLVGQGAAWVSSATKWLRGFCWTTNVTIPALATLNQTPLPPPAPRSYNWTESKFIGVTISANASAVVHEDGSSLDPRTPYNVWGSYRGGCPPH